MRFLALYSTSKPDMDTDSMILTITFLMALREALELAQITNIQIFPLNKQLKVLMYM